MKCWAQLAPDASSPSVPAAASASFMTVLLKLLCHMLRAAFGGGGLSGSAGRDDAGGPGQCAGHAGS